MSILTPLGFIALSAFIIFFLIYFIKPSYKTKVINSTYIWEESLKYRKNRNKTSKLRNILLIILEILIILVTIFILVTPFVKTKDVSLVEQNVIIVDASANMKAESSDGSTRFSRAISQIKEFSSKSIDKKKPVTIIYSGSEANMVVSQEMDKQALNNKLDSLSCSASKGDIDGAMKLVNEFIKKNAFADVYYYTATTYNDVSDVKIVDVKNQEDWNMAILDVKAENIDNRYEYEIDLISYGIDTYVNVNVEVKGVNKDETTIKAKKRVNCVNGVVKKVRFADLGIYEYDSIKVNISLDDNNLDSFKEDNEYILYGGRKHQINIQYYSNAHNNFFDAMTRVLRNNYKDVWDIKISEPATLEDVKYKGFDLYIFEHNMPMTLPTDGVVFLVNPDKVPNDLDIELGSEVYGDFNMNSGVNDDLVKYMDLSKITATMYKPIKAGEKFETLINCNGESVYVVDKEDKIAILSLNPNKSNLPIIVEFPIMVTNLFNEFIPPTIQKNVFEVGEEIIVAARGTDVELKGENEAKMLVCPTSVKLDENGEYLISQRLNNNRKIVDKLFVKVPNIESDINRVVKDSGNTFIVSRPADAEQDIYVYLAAMLLVFIVVERFLYSKENV